MLLIQKQSVISKGSTMLETTGKRMRALRYDLELEQREVVEIMARHGVEIVPSHYSKMENDTTKPSINVLVAIAKALGTTPNYLSLYDDDPRGHNEKDLKFSAEADDVAEIMDKLDSDNRQFLLAIAQYLQKLDQEQRDADEMIISLLSNNMPHLPNGEQRRAKSAIDQLTRHRRSRLG